MRTMTTILLFLMVLAPCFAQDEITLRSGDAIKARVTEVGIDEIVYAKWGDREGPVYKLKKSEVFMVKYEDGTSEVFDNPTREKQSNERVGPSATIYFYRPKKFAGSAPEIIVGTIVPDEVIVKVHNGSWYKTEYANFGERKFVTGVYSINPESFDLTIEPGMTYYIRCTLKSSGFKMMAELTFVDEGTATQEMSSLKQQIKNK